MANHLIKRKSNEIRSDEAAFAKLQIYGERFMAALGLSPEKRGDKTAQDVERLTNGEANSASLVENKKVSESDINAKSDFIGDFEKGSKGSRTNEKRYIRQQQEVVVFKDPTTHRTSSGTVSRREWKAFMSPKINQINNVPTTRNQPATAQEQREEEENRIQDKALDELLYSSNLIERVVTEKLTGKERRKHQEAKIIELGAKAIKSKGRTPFLMHIGIQASRQARVDKKLEESRNHGMYRHSLRKQLETEHGVIRKRENKARKDRGLRMATGTYRDGALHVEEQDIKRVTGESKALSTNKRHRKGEEGGKKKKKKKKF